MKYLTQNDIWSLDQYNAKRDLFKKQLMTHKKDRRLPIGPNATIYFEDRLTMQYQVQEMLRIEGIVVAEDIQQELDVYNALIPDGSNWKATFMLEFSDVEERKIALSKMIDIESHIWVQIGDHEKIIPFSDEDLERTNEHKTSAVHFIRFELPVEQVATLKAGEVLSFGISHAVYNHTVNAITDNMRKLLLQDLD